MKKFSITGKSAEVTLDDNAQIVEPLQFNHIGIAEHKPEPKAEEAVVDLVDAVLVRRFLE